MNNKHHPGSAPLREPLAVVLIVCLHTLCISIGSALSLAGTPLVTGCLFHFSVYLERCGAVSGSKSAPRLLNGAVQHSPGHHGYV